MQNSFVDPKVEGPFPTLEIRASAFAYIHERIKECEAMINYYKGRSNALTMICQLPPEILSAIFLEVSFSQSGKHEYIHWIRSISHVCAYWRKIALSTASLWSNIPVENKPWATEMISRSNNGPLTISYRGILDSDKLLEPENCYAVLEDLLQLHLPRIKSLTLDSRYPHRYLLDNAHDLPYHNDMSRKRFVKLLTFLKQPAPMLEHLEIYALWRNSSENIKYPVKLPQLRHLTLVGCAVTWAVSSFDLRSLNISQLPEAIKPTVTQFLHMLRRTPLLESFSVTSIKQSSENGDKPSQRKPVSLQYLACMELSCILPDCIYLLDHLNFSGRKLREITLNIESPQSSHVNLVTDLARTIESKCDGRVQKLVLDEVLRFRTSQDSSSHSCTVVVDFIGSAPQYRASFWQSLHLDHLSFLDVCEDFYSAEQWSIFSSLPDLKSIRVSSGGVHVLEALVQQTINEPHTPSLAFPALKRLTVVEWDKEMVDQMVSCLKFRHSMGLPLECLCLNNCFEDDDDESVAAILTRLREYVKDVKTDEDDDSDDE